MDWACFEKRTSRYYHIEVRAESLRHPIGKNTRCSTVENQRCVLFSYICTAIGFCYISPENSVFYGFNDVDLFDCLEESVAHFKDFYNVYVAGNLN